MKVSQVREYKQIILEEDPGSNFEILWRVAVDTGHLYVKFDDDLVG